MNRIRCNVEAYWDSEATVWTTSSEDVPGLATEAETLEALTQKLRTIIPELLQLNGIIPNHQQSTISIELVSHRQELIQMAGYA
jgi:predicted RNase H-like HicB family nuclease